MADAESLHLAKAFCPGIRPDATHEEFVEEGQSYLEENGLVASDPEHEGHALLPFPKRILPFNLSGSLPKPSGRALCFRLRLF